MKRILVAGAGGYLGMVLCPILIQAGYRVTAFDRFFFGKKPEGCDIVTGDIRTISAIEIDGHHAVVDLAGLSNDATCEIDPQYTFEINHLGGCNLATMAKAAGIQHYIYASSASVYGHGFKDGLTEEDAINPQTAYAKSKASVEAHLRKLTDNDFRPTVLRFATLFGVSPRMRFDLAVNIMTLRAKREGIIYVMGGGDQWRPFLHVRDAANSIRWAIEDEETRGETFNVGSEGEQCTIKQLARVVSSMVPATVLEVPEGPDNRTYNLSFGKYAKARRDAGPPLNIAWGIEEVLDGLQNGTISGDDKTTYTLQWYSAMLEWNARIEQLRGGGPIL